MGFIPSDIDTAMKLRKRKHKNNTHTLILPYGGSQYQYHQNKSGSIIMNDKDSGRKKFAGNILKNRVFPSLLIFLEVRRN